MPRKRPDPREKERVTLADGTKLVLRPLELGDLAQAQAFFDEVSEESRYMRLLRAVPRLTPELILEFVTPRSERSLIFVATAAADGGARIVGGARIEPTADPEVGEFALTVTDAWQGRGLGTALMHSLCRRARRLGYARIEGHLLAINAKMLQLSRRFRFKLESEGPGTGLILASRRLPRLPRARAASGPGGPPASPRA